MTDDRRLGIGLGGILLLGLIVVALVEVLVADPTAIGGEPVVIRGERRVVRSGDAAADSLPVGVQSRQATTHSSANMVASYDAPLYSWEGGAEGDAWYNRPIRDYHQPAPESRYQNRYDWADAMWFVIMMDRYNDRFGFPIGIGFSGWVDSWNTDCNPRR